MNHRMTAAAALAVFLASVSLFAVVGGTQWLVAGAGAVILMAFAGTVTRMAPLPAAAGATVAALLASLPLTTGEGWPGRVLAAVVLTVTIASATGQRLLRAMATGLTYAAVLLIYLSLITAGPDSGGPLTIASVRHLGVLLQQAMTESHFAPPVQPVPGIVLVTAGGIGIIAAVTDLIAVRLRSPAIAGLPLLILFSVPITTSARESGVPEGLAFFLGVAGFLILLATDSRERLRFWGRLVTVWRDSGPGEAGEGPNTTALSASGRRVGVAAICAAIVVPLVVPTLHVSSLFRRDGGSGNGPGTVLSNPLLKMDDELRLTRPRPVLSYQILGGDRSSGQYLQTFVLNYDPDSQDWVQLARGRSRPVAAGRLLGSAGLNSGVPTQDVRLRIQLGQVSDGYGASYLPLPYQAEKLDVPGSWRQDDGTGEVYSSQSLSNLSYTVTSGEPEPTAVQEAEAPAGAPRSLRGYLQLNISYRRQLRQIAEGITRHAAAPFAKAVALQNWFLHGGHFSYSLRPGLPDGAAGLLDFVTKKRVGFCQQFAVAMASLARLIGIPSRIVVGYTGGTRQHDGSWLVTTSDYHSWPELYFTGLGWLRFEPTPGGKAGQGTAIQPSYASPKAGGAGATAPNFGGPGGRTTQPSAKGGGNTNKIRAFPRGPDGEPPGARAAAGRGGSPLLALLIALAVLLAACAAPAVARLAIRRRRWQAARGDAGQAHAAWQELRDSLTDFGLGLRPSESPRAAAARIGAGTTLHRDAAAALRRIALAEERARYAPVPWPAADLAADVATVHRALARRASRRARWRARLMPASVLIPAAAGLRRALDVLGGLGAGRTRSRRIRRGAEA